MPTPTYTPLANITLGSSAASVTFSSISQAYRDLVLVISGKSATGNDQSKIRFNGDTGSNFYEVVMEGNGTTAFSGAGSPMGSFIYLSYNYYDLNATDFNSIVINVMDYSATDKHKTVLARTNKASSHTGAVAGRWANTAAITTLLVQPDSFSWAAGSSFALYGIAA